MKVTLSRQKLTRTGSGEFPSHVSKVLLTLAWFCYGRNNGRFKSCARSWLSLGFVHPNTCRVNLRPLFLARHVKGCQLPMVSCYPLYPSPSSLALFLLLDPALQHPAAHHQDLIGGPGEGNQGSGSDVVRPGRSVQLYTQCTGPSSLGEGVCIAERK